MSKKADLIDGHVSAKQCKKAVDALLAHARKHQAAREETELLPGKEQHVWLQVAVKKMHPERKLKPHKIPVKHPLVDPRTTPVCLITKDPQREYKDLLEAHGVKFVNRVVGIAKLKGKFKPFEARRLLLQENGLFLADERVVPLLPPLLGKIFFKAKKQPIPVNLTRKDLKGELERAISSTYMHQNQGTCTSVKIATLAHTPAQVLANLQTALPAVVKALKGEWDNVQSLSIKTNSSAALPIWSCALGDEAGGRWDGLTVEDGSGEEGDENDGAGDADEEMEVEVEPAPVKEDFKKADATTAAVAAKSKKRAAEEQNVDVPKKKAKASPEAVAPPKPSKASKEAAKPEMLPPPPKEQTAALKKRRRANADTDISPSVSVSASATTPPTTPTDDVPSPPKKSKKKAALPVSTTESPIQLSVASGSEADVESSAGGPTKSKKDKKERKKARSSVVVEESTTITSPLVPVRAESEAIPDASSSKKKKKAKKTEADAHEPAPESQTKAVVEKETEKAGLSKEELKLKRATGVVGEKKKEKVLKAKGKKEAKEAVVGKKLKA